MQEPDKSYQGDLGLVRVSWMKGQGRVWKRKIKGTFQAEEAAFAKVWKRKFEEMRFSRAAV